MAGGDAEAEIAGGVGLVGQFVRALLHVDPDVLGQLGGARDHRPEDQMLGDLRREAPTFTTRTDEQAARIARFVEAVACASVSAMMR
jgi:hypothetical protein